MTGVGAAVAVTGAAVLAPLAEELDDFAAGLLAGRSSVAYHEDGAVPASLLAGFTARGWAGRHLGGRPGTAAALRSTVGRAALPAQAGACVAVKAVLDAGLPLPGDDETRDSGDTAGWGGRSAVVVAGGQLALAHQARTVLDHHRNPAGLRASYALAHMDADVVGAVSEVLGVRGEGSVVGGASASGLLALVHGARLVAAGWADHAVVVAPPAELSAAECEAFRLSGALAEPAPGEPAEQVCRPFDTARGGFVRGEGAAAVVLERAATAERRGARVRAALAGYGQRLDARRGTAPDAAGQAAAMGAALDAAGLRPADLDYVNAHGTGSVLGDETEARSLLDVFGEHGPLVNSTKPLTGHCLAAAGLLEAVAVLVQLKEGVCHPNPNLARPLEPRLRLVGGRAERRRLRTALSNSFAFGGINVSVAFRAA